MASRSSANFSSEYYQGTRRGRVTMGDIDYSMFPEKYESSEALLFEDPEQVHDDRRETLKDFTPENATLMAYEEPRRNTGSVYRLNIRDHGSPKSGTDPWQNEDFDTQFHDKDPRGYLTEQPWNEYRRHMEAQLSRIDFKDDSDNSVTGGGIHPNTMYKNIRGAQSWVAARLKIFETSYESRSSGGVGVYDNISNVFKSENEETSVLTDGTSGLSTTFEDPIVRQRVTMKLSNILHEGSAALRANTTTDHVVKVASYGKLYGQRGLIPHETQLRLVEDDNPWSKMEKAAGLTPKGLVNFMATSVSGKEGMTAAAAGRVNKQKTGDSTKFNDTTHTAANRNNIVAGDILALLGITQNEVKFLESFRGQNRKMADHMLANIYKLTEVVHRMPMHEKLQAREALLLQSAGGHLAPSDPSKLRKTRDQVVVNPKFIEFMHSVVAKGKDITGNEFMQNKWKGKGDSEGRLSKGNPIQGVPIFVLKNQAKNVEKITEAFWNGSEMQKRPDLASDKKTHSYAGLKREISAFASNRKDTRITHDYQDTESFAQGKRQDPGDYAPTETLRQTEVDTHFQNFLVHNRHIGTGMSGKSRVRRNIETSEMSYDKNAEIGVSDMVGGGGARKNPKSRTTMDR
jgi:hypothetical protein